MNLIQRVANFDSLEKSWNSLKSGKTPDARRALRGIDGFSIDEFKKEAKKNLQNLSKSLFDGSYKISPVKAFFFKKGNKKDYRLIAPPSVEDAIVHHSILRELIPIFQNQLNNGVSYCGVPGLSKTKRVNHLVALKNLHIQFAKGNYFVFGSDIQSFFDGINKDTLLERLLTALPDNSLDVILHDIVYFKVGNYNELKKENKGKLPARDTNKGIAQGSPLSPFFSNIYLADFDSIMSQLFGGQFFRYVDDFVIVGKSEFEIEEYGGIVEHLLNEEHLSLVEDKTKLCNLNLPKGFFNFLGLKLSRYEVQQKKNQQEILSIIEKEYLSKKKYKQKEQVTFINAVNRKLQGYGNYYRSFHTIPMLKAINKIIDHRNQKFSELSKVLYLDASGRKQFMTKEKWQSAFKV